MAMKAEQYQVAWQWSDPDVNGLNPIHDDVMATNAEQAIRKVRRMLTNEYSMKRTDIVILEAYKI